MSELLWQKPGVEVDAGIQAFLAGDDVVLDREFIQDDITASAAHARGLARIGVLTGEECEALCRELGILSDDLRSGAFVLDERFEDCHSAIESRLVERLGDVGRKIHTGRSRNDQVLVATRLWLKRKLREVQAVCREVAEVCLKRAEAEAIPMPGYTHLQRAVVSSTAMWWAGFAEAFIDNAVRAGQAHDWIDANPLGTAAGYGVNLPLDREGSTRELGFARMQVSPIYAQLSRGKFEIAAVDALGAAVLDLRRLAWDLSLFTTAEFGFVTLPPQYTTGSSIMPNKRNPDLVELMRATYASIAASRTELEQLLSLPTGYHRDLQFTKGALYHAFGRGLGALGLLPNLLRGMAWNTDRLAKAFDNGMYATDKAVELAVAGMPFREAYRLAAVEPLPKAGADAQASLDARVSPGGAGVLGLGTIRQRLAGLARLQ
jgi:argininosuccinate lyase